MCNNLIWDIVSDKIRIKYMQFDFSVYKVKRCIYFFCI